MGVAVAAVVLAAVAVPVPFVGSEVSTAPSEFASTIEDTETDGCGTATVTAGLTATVHRPLVDVLGISWLTDVEVTGARLGVAQDPRCGERAAEIADGFGALTPTGECSEWNAGQEQTSAVAVDCGGTGVRLQVVTDEGVEAVDGSGLVLAIAGGLTRGPLWCLEVDQGLTFLDGGTMSTVGSGTLATLCLDLA
ncbi:hypothetical protein [Demequina gelatinilytica]|uniref:hypothetical protein n=1 Tax=Demequina gelatinilytica TaxID=1638980 RepID=UPI000781E4F2|nr:hypothetical protein [Demequina gelatinilytica]